MSKTIVESIRGLKKQIDAEGLEINGTREIVGVKLDPLRVHEMDLLTEEDAIRDYYNENSINIQAVRSLELNLYEFIYRGLRQAVEQLLYFDKTQNFTARRFVFSTTDCIAFVQLLYRNDRATLFAHIRSTDVVKLLPWDLLFLCKLVNRVLTDSGFPQTREKHVIVSVASAHYYLIPPKAY